MINSEKKEVIQQKSGSRSDLKKDRDFPSIYVYIRIQIQIPAKCRMRVRNTKFGYITIILRFCSYSNSLETNPDHSTKKTGALSYNVNKRTFIIFTINFLWLLTFCHMKEVFFCKFQALCWISNMAGSSSWSSSNTDPDAHVGSEWDPMENPPIRRMRW